MTTATVEVPAYVRKQAEADARREQEELAARSGNPPPQPNEGSPDAKVNEGPTPEERTSLQDLLGPDAAGEQPPVTLPNPKPALESTSTSPQLAERIAAMEEELAIERQRNKTLRGKLDAEGPRNAEEIRELRDELRRLKEERESRSRSPAWQRHLSEDERTEFKTAEDAMGVSGRVILGVLEDRLEKIEAAFASKVKPVEESVRRITTESADAKKLREEADRVDRVLAKVEVHRAGAKDTNFNDPMFTKFLHDVKEPISGSPWGEIAARALQGNDIARLVQVFQAYDQMRGVATPQTEVGALVRPSTVRGTVAPGAGKAKPTITERWVNQFYTDVSYGRYKGRDEEKKQIEAMIEDAERDGRIVPG